MFRKLLGVVTAAIAGMLLVGVAWAAGDGVEDISSGNTEGTAASSTQATAGSSTQATTASSSSLGTTGSSTPATTSTTVPGSSTSTSIDDDREETRGPAPVNAGPTSHQVGSAGTVTVQITDGHLLLIAATAAPGWETEVDRDDGEEVRVEFESGESDARFEARVHNDELRVRIQAG
jgi:lysozyme